MKLNKIAKMVRAEKSNEIAQQFVNDLIYTIEKENESDYIPTRSYKPSGIAGCKRGLYYQMIGAQPDEQSSGLNLIGICESGTDRHETIQDYIQQMAKYTNNCKWINVAKYLHSQGITDPQVVSQEGNETKLFSKKYNMRFMCDGLVNYKGEYYIIEIKTESTHKYNSHDEPHQSHKLQAACYSMCIGVPKVIFIYENRDNCSKKGYLFEVPKEMIENIEDTIQYVDDCVRLNVVPPKEPKCTYCKYKNTCAREDANELW